MGGIIVGGERVSVGSVLHLLAAELVAPSRVILGVVLLDPLLAVKVARISLARTQLHRRMKAVLEASLGFENEVFRQL